MLRKLSLALFFVSLSVVSALAADLTGKWSGTLQTPDGARKITFDFKVNGSTLTGKINGPAGQFDIQEGMINGDRVSFYQLVPFPGYDLQVDFTGTIQGDSIRFKRKMGIRPGGEFTATRDK